MYMGTYTGGLLDLLTCIQGSSCSICSLVSEHHFLFCALFYSSGCLCPCPITLELSHLGPIVMFLSGFSLSLFQLLFSWALHYTVLYFWSQLSFYLNSFWTPPGCSYSAWSSWQFPASPENGLCLILLKSFIMTSQYTFAFWLHFPYISALQTQKQIKPHNSGSHVDLYFLKILLLATLLSSIGFHHSKLLLCEDYHYISPHPSLPLAVELKNRRFCLAKKKRSSDWAQRFICGGQ